MSLAFRREIFSETNFPKGIFWIRVQLNAAPTAAVFETATHLFFNSLRIPKPHSSLNFPSYRKIPSYKICATDSHHIPLPSESPLFSHRGWGASVSSDRAYQVLPCCPGFEKSDHAEKVLAVKFYWPSSCPLLRFSSKLAAVRMFWSTSVFFVWDGYLALSTLSESKRTMYYRYICNTNFATKFMYCSASERKIGTRSC